MKKIILTICILIVTFSELYAQKNINVAVFSKTAGFRHESIETGIAHFKKWAKTSNWDIVFSEETSFFSDENLAFTDVLVFLNTTGDILDESSKKAIKKYINKGGGFVGIHSASDTEYNWPWYYQMIGAQFKSHPKIQQATLHVNHTSKHPSIKHFNTTFKVVDEWYNFNAPVLSHVNVLMSLDEKSYEGGTMNNKHPIAWYHFYDGGRVFYTGMGHTNDIFDNPLYEKHIIEAVNWASGITN